MLLSVTDQGGQCHTVLSVHECTLIMIGDDFTDTLFTKHLSYSINLQYFDICCIFQSLPETNSWWKHFSKEEDKYCSTSCLCVCCKTLLLLQMLYSLFCLIIYFSPNFVRLLLSQNKCDWLEKLTQYPEWFQFAFQQFFCKSDWR